jgi:hypothetical protein
MKTFPEKLASDPRGPAREARADRVCEASRSKRRMTLKVHDKEEC